MKKVSSVVYSGQDRPDAGKVTVERPQRSQNSGLNQSPEHHKLQIGLLRRPVSDTLHRDGASRRRRYPETDQWPPETRHPLQRVRNMASSRPNGQRITLPSLDQHPTSRFEVRQCLHHLWSSLQIRWSQRFQSRQKRYGTHSDRHSLLHQSWGMERSSLWRQMRCMVSWLCCVRNGHFKASFQSEQPQIALRQNPERLLLTFTSFLLRRSKKCHYSMPQSASQPKNLSYWPVTTLCCLEKYAC